MEFAQALTFRYSSVAQEILCGPDTIASLCGTLDRLGAETALIVCGPSILHKSNVISRVQNALGQRCVGTFKNVLRVNALLLILFLSDTHGRPYP